jgi:hypothetical protein
VEAVKLIFADPVQPSLGLTVTVTDEVVEATGPVGGVIAMEYGSTTV